MILLKPNQLIKYGRSEFANTRPENITIIDRTNQQPKILLNTCVYNWANLTRKAMLVLRPIIDEIGQIVDFETLFNNAIDDITKIIDFKFDNNFSKELYTRDDFITSSIYKKNINHKIYIMTNEQGERLHICAVYTCEIMCLLQAMIKVISKIYNIEIIIQYKPKTKY